MEEVHGPSIISSLRGNIHFLFLVVYQDASSRRPDPSVISKLEHWHSDVGSDLNVTFFCSNMLHYQSSYELQPPSITSLKVITNPEVGGDTLWSSG